MQRFLPFERPRNFRDLGGYRGDGGRYVRPGVLYRADSLAGLAGSDLERFRELGVRTVIDLRSPWEIEATGRVPEQEGLAYHNCPVEHRPYDQAALTPDIDPGTYLPHRFMEVAEDGTRELREALKLIASDSPAPTVFHGASGKDRTGQLAALVLSSLGVRDDDIVADFALTGRATDALVADWCAANPDRGPLWPGYAKAPAATMRNFLTLTRERYGSVDTYVAEQLGLGGEFTEALRQRLLVADPLTYRRAGATDLTTLVRLRDDAARWMLANGINQWRPGEKGEEHFRRRIDAGEVWLALWGAATSGADGPVAGAWELWWADPLAWGERPADAGYVHRLMVDRSTAPSGAGRLLLAAAERRIGQLGLTYSRLDCVASNPRLRTYYESAGYTHVGEGVQQDRNGDTYPVLLLEKRL